MTGPTFKVLGFERAASSIKSCSSELSAIASALESNSTLDEGGLQPAEEYSRWIAVWAQEARKAAEMLEALGKDVMNIKDALSSLDDSAAQGFG